MKLLKLEIGDLPKDKQFRSLHAGFKVVFHSLDENGIKAMESFNPFCFAGLNGSGKSNVLEALAAIFYHLECCVAKFKPKSFEKHFRPIDCNPDAFTLEYLIGRHSNNEYALSNLFKIIIKKESGKAPRLYRQSYPFTETEKLIEESIKPPKKKGNQEPAPAKIYLPDVIIGYSSGENEILSLPFRKSRLLNFDKYREDSQESRQFEEPENSLIYIDAEMSQAVLLACLIFDDEETLKPLREELGIIGLRSFRMNLNNHKLHEKKDSNKTVAALNHISETIENLKKCATTWQEFDLNISYQDNSLATLLILDFLVDVKTKQLFRDNFKTSFELFRFFQVLYELNSISISESIKEEVYKSKGFYTDGKLSVGSPDENVFFFLDYLILKEIDGEAEPKPLLLREFSDGEHQFLHTMGICLMLKDRRSLLLLDEPETHFNPNWRAKFIKILDDSIKAGSKSDRVNGSFNVHLLKDILLTSHSPFIISDCISSNVILFRREGDGKIMPRTAMEMNFNTYGASVDLILQEIFGMEHSISKHALEEIRILLRKRTVEPIIEGSKRFGESYEKGFLYERIEELHSIRKKKAKK